MLMIRGLHLYIFCEKLMLTNIHLVAFAISIQGRLVKFDAFWSFWLVLLFEFAAPTSTH